MALEDADAGRVLLALLLWLWARLLRWGVLWEVERPSGVLGLEAGWRDEDLSMEGSAPGAGECSGDAGADLRGSSLRVSSGGAASVCSMLG